MKTKFLSLFLLLSTALFAARSESYYYPVPRSDRLYEPTSKNPPKVDAYSAPARVDVRSSWDIFFKGSFTYWQAREEGLELATSNDQSDPFGVNGIIINTDFSYKPGFKAGLGLHSQPDDWEAYVEYTWFRSNVKTRSTRPAGGVLIPRWFDPFFNATEVESKWRLRMDTIDAELARTHFVGRHLTMRPFFSGRLLFIKQRLAYRAESFNARNRSKSWALGPRAGVDMNFLMGYGFRIFGEAAASILYTKYTTKVKNDDVFGNTDFVLNVKDKISLLRPNAEFALGAAWGTYFSHHRFYIELSASYDWKVFWNQNMMRHLSDNAIGRIDGNYGDLYLQGATATLRFDF